MSVLVLHGGYQRALTRYEGYYDTLYLRTNYSALERVVSGGLRSARAPLESRTALLLLLITDGSVESALTLWLYDVSDNEGKNSEALGGELPLPHCVRSVRWFC